MCFLKVVCSGMILLICNMLQQYVARESGIMQGKFTKLNCTSHDESIIHYDRCFIKAVNRDTNYLTIQHRLFQLPIRKYGVHLETKYRANGWKPFLYDFTIDICQFMQHANSPLGKLFFEATQNREKFNCPVTQSVQSFENITNKYVAGLASRLPIPSGDYALFTTWFMNDTLVSNVDFYVSVYWK